VGPAFQWAPEANTMKCSRYLCAALCALAMNSQVLAAPGDLDFTFGQAGRVFVDVDNDDDSPAGLALQPDGKIIVGRWNTDEDDDFSVMRFMPDGSRDTSYDHDGRTSASFPSVWGHTVSVVLQPDGKVVAVGWARATGSTRTRLALARYLANGSIDVSFGDNGLVVVDAEFDGIMLSAMVQSDGRLVVAGQVSHSAIRNGLALARFNPDGSLDQSFGQSGYAYSNSVSSEWGASVARQSDGKLLAFADLSALQPQAWYDWQPLIMRFHADGSADTTFGTNGRATLPLYTSFLSALVQPDGKILLAAANDPAGWDIAYCGSMLARLHPDGVPDEGFGFDGMIDTNIGGCQALGAAMLTQPDGRIVLNGGGATIHAGSPVIDTFDHIVTRLSASGERDASFGDAGQATLDVGDGEYPPYSTSTGSLLRQDDGKLLVLTSGIQALTSWGDNNRLVLARLLPSGGSPGLIGIKAVDPQISGSDGGIVLRVRRSGGSEGQVSVDYSSESGARGTLTWADGDRDDKVIMTRAGAGSLALSNVTGGAGLAMRVIQLPAAPAPPPAPTPPGSSGGGGALSWELLLALALVVRRRWSSPAGS
jgi:uncharacterized delta-60 repeat protein